jgi:hypothetical protein
MTDEQIETLVKRYEDDILFDCHSLPIKISRSEARREISELSPAEHKEIKKFLENHTVKTIYPALAEEVRQAWSAVLG